LLWDSEVVVVKLEKGYLWGWLDMMHWLGREDVESLCTQEQVLQTLGLL
jgi:hypothetical protein